MSKHIPENIKAEDLEPFAQQEIDLIFILRNKYQYGSVEIVMRDGLPNDILRTVERTRLGNLSPTDFDGTQ